MFTHTMRRTAPYGWVAVALTLLYLAGIFVMRHTAPILSPAARNQLPEVPAGYFGTKSEIAQFYAAKGVLVRGEHTVICYGTRNVANVRLNPPDEDLVPALNRCFAISPGKTTTYTLEAVGTDGQTLTQSFTIQVNPAPSRFTMIAVSARKIARGERWSLCYSTENAFAVRLEPTGVRLPAGQKRCAMFYPALTTQFRLTAIGESGKQTTETIPKLTVAPRGEPSSRR